MLVSSIRFYSSTTENSLYLLKHLCVNVAGDDFMLVVLQTFLEVDGEDSESPSHSRVRFYCTAVVRWGDCGWGVDEKTEGGEFERAWFTMTVCYTFAFVLSWWMVLCLRDCQGDGVKKVFCVNWEYGRGFENY